MEWRCNDTCYFCRRNSVTSVLISPRSFLSMIKSLTSGSRYMKALTVSLRRFVTIETVVLLSWYSAAIQCWRWVWTFLGTRNFLPSWVCQSWFQHVHIRSSRWGDTELSNWCASTTIQGECAIGDGWGWCCAAAYSDCYIRDDSLIGCICFWQWQCIIL